MAAVPDDVINKVKAYGKGLLSKWSPQQTILSHPVSSFPRLRSYLVVLMVGLAYSFRPLGGSSHIVVKTASWSRLHLAYPCMHNFINDFNWHSPLPGLFRICWPFSGDQPTNAARLASILDVAYELFEVRTGEHGLKPIYRLGHAPIGTMNSARDEVRSVLEKAFGEDGAKKRANMKLLQGEFLKAWDEEGLARKDLRRFVSTLGS